MSVINRQHEHTVRLEAQAYERQSESKTTGDDRFDALVNVLLAISKRLELIEGALRGREA